MISGFLSFWLKKYIYFVALHRKEKKSGVGKQNIPFALS